MNKYEILPIHAFALRGDTESIRLLLDHGADPNARTGSTAPESPLDTAIFFNKPETAKLLIERGAKPTKRTSELIKHCETPEMLRIVRAGLNSMKKGLPHRR